MPEADPRWSRESSVPCKTLTRMNVIRAGSPQACGRHRPTGGTHTAASYPSGHLSVPAETVVSHRIVRIVPAGHAGWPGLLPAGCVSIRNLELTFCGVERSFLFNVRAEVSCAAHPA